MSRNRHTVFELHIGNQGMDGMASAEREPVKELWGFAPGGQTAKSLVRGLRGLCPSEAAVEDLL